MTGTAEAAGALAADATGCTGALAAGGLPPHAITTRAANAQQALRRNTALSPTEN
jgi:hypothetical protein